MSQHIDGFSTQCRAMLEDPFDTTEALAGYLLSPDHDATDYQEIRLAVWEAALSGGSLPIWLLDLVELVVSLPEARMLIVDCKTRMQRLRIGVEVLNTALVLITGDDPPEECGR